MGHGLLSAWQRRALRRANQLWLQPFSPLIEACDRLGIESGRRSSAYFPLVVDTDLFRPGAPDLSRPWVAEMTRDSDFVVFSPTRIVFDTSPAMTRSGQTKGSRTLLLAWAEFVRREVVERPVLALPDWSSSDDLSLAKELVEELGIAHTVRFLRTPRSSGFHRHEIADLHRAADAVVDEFGCGWFGYVSLEALSSGTPVVSHVDLDVIAQLYPDGHPWLAARTAAEAADRFSELAADPDLRATHGRESRAWALANHEPGAAARRYIDAVATVAPEILSGEAARG